MYIAQIGAAGELIVIDVETRSSGRPSSRTSMSAREETPTPHVPNSPSASGSSVSYPYSVGMSYAIERPVWPAARRALNRRFVPSAAPKPANIRIVQRRDRYPFGWMPRVYGGSPGIPTRAASSSADGDHG